MADNEAKLSSEVALSREDTDGHLARAAELESDLRAAQTAMAQLESSHATAVDALHQEHASATTEHVSTRAQLEADLEASKARAAELLSEAGEQSELSEQITALQEQIAAEKATAEEHWNLSEALNEQLEDSRAAAEAVQSVATASALETSALSDQILSLQEQLAKEGDGKAEHQERSTVLSTELEKAQTDLAKIAREQEMDAEHHRVKLASLERAHSEAIAALASEHEDNLSVELETQSMAMQEEASTAQEAAERAAEGEQAHVQRADQAEEESRQQAAEVGRLLQELEAMNAECLAAKAIAAEAEASRGQAQAVLAEKAEEHQALVDASKLAAEEGAALESNMTALSDAVSTKDALRAAAEQQAAEHSAALEEAKAELAEFKAQAELTAAEHAEQVEDHKVSLSASELDVEEAEKAATEAQVLLEVVKTEHMAAKEAATSHGSAVSELQEQLATAVADLGAEAAAHSELRQHVEGLEAVHSDNLANASAQAASSVAAAISYAQTGEKATSTALRREMTEMEERMAAEVADVARQAAERVTAAERRLQQSLATTANAQAQTSELKKVVAAMTEAREAAHAVAGTPPSQRGAAAKAAKGSNGKGKSSGGASHVRSADDSLVQTQAKLAISEDALKKARLEARVRIAISPHQIDAFSLTVC